MVTTRTNSETNRLETKTMTTTTAKQDRLIASFIQTAKIDAPDVDVTTITANGNCGVWTRDGRDIPCLAAYEDELGNWITLDLDGRVRQFLADEIS